MQLKKYVVPAVVAMVTALAALSVPDVEAQVSATPAPNLTTLYGSNTVLVRQQYDYTGAQVTITAPANAVGVYFKIWGAGGGHEAVVDASKAGVAIPARYSTLAPAPCIR